MGIDIWTSRRDCFEECKWWNRDEDNFIENDELIHQIPPTGIFYAKEYSPEIRDSSVIAGVFMFDRQSVTLRSTDDLNNLHKNAMVLYKGEKWIVDNIQKKQMRNRATEFADDSNVSHCWYIQMRK